MFRLVITKKNPRFS